MLLDVRTGNFLVGMKATQNALRSLFERDQQTGIEGRL